jgi:hypothetical protein
MKYLVALLLFFSVSQTYCDGHFICRSQTNQGFFSIDINGEEAVVKHLLLEGFQCTSQESDELVFEIVCEKGAELVAVMYDHESAGAMVSNRYGAFEHFTCLDASNR